jgi:hypothetical protein
MMMTGSWSTAEAAKRENRISRIVDILIPFRKSLLTHAVGSCAKSYSIRNPLRAILDLVRGALSTI